MAKRREHVNMLVYFNTKQIRIVSPANLPTNIMSLKHLFSLVFHKSANEQFLFITLQVAFVRFSIQPVHKVSYDKSNKGDMYLQ